VIVLDASVAVEMLLGSRVGQAAGELLRTDGALHYPELMPVEAMSAIRRLVLTGHVTVPRATAAVDDLTDLAGKRHGHGPYLSVAFGLSFRFSPYDAIYVALASILDATLMTLDARLAREAATLVEVEVPG
jgi:predicted nucleic acid-binding protein